jgi:hypothetical protein
MEKIRNETVRREMEIKKDVSQEIEEQQLGWYGSVM